MRFGSHRSSPPLRDENFETDPLKRRGEKEERYCQQELDREREARPTIRISSETNLCGRIERGGERETQGSVI